METRFFKYSNHIYWHGSWSCDQHHVYLIFIFLYPKNYIQNLVENGPVVIEKSKFQFLYVNNIGPRSTNDFHLQYSLRFTELVVCNYKGPLSWYRKLTRESAHAWNLMILCSLNALGMTPIIMVHLIFYVFPLSIYDVIYDITTKPEGTLL